jgi:hypothetical protein
VTDGANGETSYFDSAKVSKLIAREQQMALESKLDGLRNRAKAIIAKAEAEGSELYKEIGQLFHDILGGEEPTDVKALPEGQGEGSEGKYSYPKPLNPPNP